MKQFFFLLLSSSVVSIMPTQAQQTENVIIITTDGFRWQEVFTGMDKIIADNSKFNQGDSTKLYKKYWSDDTLERRKKLLPFMWSTIAEKGQVYGNRLRGNLVNNANPYKFSYPGYSEIFCGYVDTAVNSNEYKPNPNTTLLEFFNKQDKLKGKIAAFGSWDAFNRILNEQRSGIPVVAGYDETGGAQPNANEQLINKMLKDSHREWDGECMDVFTHYEAMEHLKNKKPRVLYISYGETDEWAHAGKYVYYLDAAHQVDAWIKEIWDFVQADAQYKNKTTVLITTDHGRGDVVKANWTNHGQRIDDSGQIWFAILGPNTPVTGEQTASQQLYQKQFAQTLAKTLGLIYTAEHPVAIEISTVLKK